MGLQHGKKYEDTKSLRYGHLMIMTDQDHDGSHIKGLIINYFETFYPSLLAIPGFLIEFITPIVKVTKGDQDVSFFTLPEYEYWKETTPDHKKWKMKYYKVCCLRYPYANLIGSWDEYECRCQGLFCQLGQTFEALSRHASRRQGIDRTRVLKKEGRRPEGMAQNVSCKILFLAYLIAAGSLPRSFRRQDPHFRLCQQRTHPVQYGR